VESMRRRRGKADSLSHVEERPLTTSYDDASRTLFVSGSIDELSGGALRDAIDKHSASYTRQLSVDLTDVDFLPSLGVGVLAVAMRTTQENGATLELVAATGTVAQQVLNICGLPYRQA
jgi:anti-anti-sigma factor